MTTNIILTTGLYDLIKDHLRRKRVTKDQVLRRDLSEDIVSVGKKVTIKELTSNEEYQLNFVSPEKAKPKKNRHSILMDEGLATIGYKKGDVVEWPTEKGTKKYEILNVETVA